MDSDPGDDDDWGIHDTEDVSQEQLFADIGDALGASNSRRGRPQGIDQRNGDLLDSELQDLHRYDSRATTIGASGVDRYASNASTLHNNDDTNYTRYVDDEEDSDPEAAAGIEAMRLADLAEQDQIGGPLSFSAYGPQTVHHQSQDESSDSDYKHMDLGLVGGGYDAHMSYGDDLIGAHTGHSSEMDDQSRPLPTPQEIGRSDSYSRNTTAAGLGGMTNYGIPGAGDIHPFPAFESARVDTFGTGGLQRPTSQSHRLSFDEGDEHVLLQSRLSESRQSGRSGE